MKSKVLEIISHDISGLDQCNLKHKGIQFRPKPGCVEFTQVSVTSTQYVGTSTQKGVDSTQVV